MSETTSQTLTLDQLKKAVACNAAAIRVTTRLDSAYGRDHKVFPSTYQGGVYAYETRRLANGEEVKCVVLDSVQSQANRFEEALLDAYDAGEISLPLLQVNFDTIPDVGRITSLDAPHRIADAIFRESELNGTPFRETPEGRAFAAATTRNATALFELCPTALVFGVWDSTGSEGGLGNKFARSSPRLSHSALPKGSRPPAGSIRRVLRSVRSTKPHPATGAYSKSMPDATTTTTQYSSDESAKQREIRRPSTLAT